MGPLGGAGGCCVGPLCGAKMGLVAAMWGWGQLWGLYVGLGAAMWGLYVGLRWGWGLLCGAGG